MEENKSDTYELNDLVEKIKYEIKKEKEKNKKPKPSNNETITFADSRYAADEKMLRQYITEDETDNKFNNTNYMYHICTLLNSFCSTRMGADRVYATAMTFAEDGNLIQEILGQEDPLDDEQLNNIQASMCQKLKLRKSERDLLEDEGKHFRSYSFATKFLAFHSEFKDNLNNGSLFPIYDGQVKTVLTKYKLKRIETLKEFVTKFDKEFEKNEEWQSFLKAHAKKTICLENYPEFYKLMRILSLATGLNLTRLDRFFWKLGDDIQKKENEKKQKNKENNKQQKN